MKKNVCAIVGGILCLVSLLMRYITFKQFGVTLYGVGWSTAARYLNTNLYFIPVIGVLMIVGGFVRGKMLSALATLAGVVMAVYYLIVFNNMVGLKSLEKLISEGSQMLTLLGNALNVDLGSGEIPTEEALEILSIVKGVQHIGQGFWFFMAGTLLSLIGLVMPEKAASARKAVETASRNESDIY